MQKIYPSFTLTSVVASDHYGNIPTPITRLYEDVQQKDEVNLADNGLTEFSDNEDVVADNANVIDLERGTIDFYYKKLLEIPPWVFDRVETKELSFKFNRLMILPSSIEKLKKLCWLDLRHNQLVILPPEIGNLTNLTYLDLSYNQLTSLPDSLARLSSNCTLNITHNPLDRKELSRIKSLISDQRQYSEGQLGPQLTYSIPNPRLNPSETQTLKEAIGEWVEAYKELSLEKDNSSKQEVINLKSYESLLYHPSQDKVHFYLKQMKLIYQGIPDEKTLLGKKTLICKIVEDTLLPASKYDKFRKIFLDTVDFYKLPDTLCNFEK